VTDRDCVEFLRWALPRLGLRWGGFRKVRGQVCKRLRRRLSEVGLADLDAYRVQLERHPEEWAVLESLTHITISRFNRDRGVFAFLQWEVLPTLAATVAERGADALEVWSAGCASGEEAFTLAIMWRLDLAPRFPELAIRILATDADEAMLARARRGCFSASSLRELPARSRAAAFAQGDRHYCLRDPFREPVRIARHDIRSRPPDGPFDLVLCRNLAFTYFDLELQRATAARLAGALRAGGALVLGSHESLPANVEEFEWWSSAERIYELRR
jgi:chemotaxis protein methyltransferase CheR